MKHSQSFAAQTPVKNYLPYLLGALAGMVAAGSLNPYLKDTPGTISYVVLAVLVIASSVGFGLLWPAQAKVPVVAPQPAALGPRVDKAAANSEDAKPATVTESKTKILDTSIIIDGRIIDIAATGFLEPPFLVPNFVLREIQLISDSPDAIKRNRGRRGLDMLNQLQKRSDLEVKISYKDYTETREVDQKLIRLAKDTGGYLVTNDFNLNKVAELQGVRVLNMNNLANALKPVVLPGEEIELQVVKEGKDENQGIAYLEDGTMVVIEGGGKLIGKKVKINVTSVIQTNAGKMVFTKLAQK
ncbi:PilT protein domain protein [Turneriella parva DSM 21527]|uniref:PilT protein domain protein n=1 Tax=Turneriella parva (strain ATCC BAA-1111 / DSM 21527 / NCTC 11395 / H) TaxID=869212 RepID=I4B5B9_TURPD|nr:PilT protein domain protein [Turneriella parva DSM 21527]